MDSRTDPMAPNTIGDDSADEEIAGEKEPLKLHEDGPVPAPGTLDYAPPGSRDPAILTSLEDDDTPGDKDGGTPYDAEGSSGAAGQ